jgi:hypothetical protein
MTTSNFLRLKTKSAAHIAFRNVVGKTLFEIDLAGVCITVTDPLTAAIEVEPKHEDTR